MRRYCRVRASATCESAIDLWDDFLLRQLGGTSMLRTRPQFVDVFRDRHRILRVYFRRNRGPRLPLPADLTFKSEAFTLAYAAALAGSVPPPRASRPKTAPG